MVGRQVLAYSPRDEQDKAHSCSDPERAIEIGVPVQDVEEGRAGVETAFAAVQDVGGVDIEVLGVEGEGPEEAF